MRNIVKLSEKDREALFENTANQMGLTDAIIEKDFWVCWTLDYLFHDCRWKDKLAFKGGTSLSKSFGLIRRFSEDIDLILDWRVLGYSINEPWQSRSNTKQDIFNKEANERAELFLKNEFLPEISRDLSTKLNVSTSCYIDSNDPQTIKFVYPHKYPDDSILQEIRLEIGSLAAWTPAAARDIRPYSSEQYPKLFVQPSTNILTVLPERTFWEKVTILHREANRPKSKAFPLRYSRHYYDLACLANSAVKEQAIRDHELLSRVVTFKEKFYRCPWALYENAKIGTLKLMPPEYNLTDLESDFQHMQNMIFGEHMSFDELLNAIQRLERELNDPTLI